MRIDMRDTRSLADWTRVHLAVAFVDLAGFTALTEAHGDEAAAEVHAAFTTALSLAESAADQVSCVKHLGDGALLVGPSTGALVVTLQQGLAGVDDRVRLRLRAGIAMGDLLAIESVFGRDYIGHVVNVAARLCGIAAPGELLVTGEHPATDGDCDGVGKPRRLGARQLRNITTPVDVWAHTLGVDAADIDPVCHMIAAPGGRAVTVAGRRWWFCSAECVERFQSQHG